MIKAFGKRNEIENVMIVWNKIIPQFELRPDQITFNQMINIFGNLHKTEMAQMFFHQMIENGIQPNQIIFNSLFNAFANNYSDSDNKY